MTTLLVKKVSRSDEFEAITRLRKNIYVSWGYLEKNHTRVDIDEYDLGAKSWHFVAYYGTKIVGTIRMILADQTPLPIERDFHHKIRLPNKRKQIVEISRLASNNKLEKHFNDGRIMIALIKAIHDYANSTNRKYWYAAIDEGLHDKFYRMGIRWQKIGAAKLYLGSKTIPAKLYLPNAMQLLKKLNPKIWTQIVFGSSKFKIS